MVENISSGQNFKAIDIGSLDQLNEHEFVHPKFGTVDKSRIFIGELLETSGAEISFRDLSPNTVIPFLHKHHKNEEIYIFLKGEGKFQVDDNVFSVKEGTVVKVMPDGNRTLSNNSNEHMIYMVVQAKINSISGYNISDGYREEGEIKL